MSRLKAASIHLLISMIIGVTVTSVIVAVWYPQPLLQVDGGITLNLLLIGVDLVMGPTLTLIVFRSGKPGLRFDLAVIALLQASALVYGLWIVASSRPVYIVLQERRATVVHRNELHGAAAGGPFSSPTLGRPRVVAAPQPSDPKLRDALLTETLSGKPDIDYRPSYYRTLRDTSSLHLFGVTLDEARETNEALVTHLDDALPRSSTADGRALRVLPLLTRGREATVVFAPKKRKIVAILDVELGKDE